MNAGVPCREARVLPEAPPGAVQVHVSELVVHNRSTTRSSSGTFPRRSVFAAQIGMGKRPFVYKYATATRRRPASSTRR
jgi:hypothetical protein